eukprot:2211412-Prymnesium_polylepis.1
MVDAALLRPGRLEQHFYVPHPDAADRAAVLAAHTAGLPLAPDVDLADLAARTERFSCAALAASCREATLCALGRHARCGTRGGCAKPAALGADGGDGGGDADDCDDGGAEGDGDGEDAGLSEAMGSMDLSGETLLVAADARDEDALPASSSSSPLLAVTRNDFDRGLQTVRLKLVPPAEAHARMLAEYEGFSIS